jgi:hypothetical protein
MSGKVVSAAPPVLSSSHTARGNTHAKSSAHTAATLAPHSAKIKRTPRAHHAAASLALLQRA